MRQFVLLTLISALLNTTALHAGELTVDLGDSSQTWQTRELLEHPLAQTVQVDNDVTYKRTMRYRAVPLKALLEGVQPEDHLQARASDGFAAEMAAKPLLATQGARAWLAIEDPATPWPPIARGKPSAGPFYLIWTDPQAGPISPEQWPFQLASIRRLPPLDSRFPALRPAPGLADDDPITRGYALFQQNCLACHRLNGAGDARMGPDLNLPFNPTEYFVAGTLERYIRNPQSLRQWPEAKMPGFSAEVLSDDDLTALISYIRHMAGRKVPLPVAPGP
ncbi:cytochrome c [Pseudomonas putida]|uniref:c-type cytochrome n=1 Tax=Pseudomonas putida TaxID=303 RepID=UPI0023639996|nr:cytochrome c [Pseudomonas putida]MDD2051094.1 cytochrome c [Pseudomonas putida]